MIDRIRLFGRIAGHFSAITTAAVAVVVAFDFGGVLHWTQLIIAYAVCAIAPAAFISLVCQSTASANRSVRPPLALLSLVTLWVAYSWLQTYEFPDRVVRVLSPGVHDAYVNWARPVSAAEHRSGTYDTHYPLSVLPHSTHHAAAFGTVLVLTTWIGVAVLNTSGRIVSFLTVLAVGCAFQSCYGLFHFLVPEYANSFSELVADPDQPHSPFGSFINPNNAGLYLNLGLAAAVGIGKWRLTLAFTPRWAGASAISYRIAAAFRDPIFVLASAGGLLACSAIAASGSSIGALGIFGGTVLLFDWFKTRGRRIALVLFAATGSVLMAFILVGKPLREHVWERVDRNKLEAIDRYTADARWSHWQDGWESATAYLPLGSGTATYAYAYLPYQRHSPSAWFLHADNLWLEILVEQGVVGLVMLIATFGLVLYHAGSLSRSHDALDKGLSTACRYAVGAVLIMGCFDFGAILPCSLLSIALISSAVTIRSSTLSSSRPPTRRSSKLTAPLKRVMLPLWGVGTIAAALGSLPALRTDAFQENAVHAAAGILDSGTVDLGEIDSTLNLIVYPAKSQTNPTLMQSESELLFRKARVLEVEAQDLDSAEAIVDAYRETGRRRRRLRPLVLNDSTREASLHYLASRRRAVEALRLTPLGIMPRAQMIYLDFAGGEPRTTELLLGQLAELQARYPKQLIRLSKLAEQSELLELSGDILRRLCLLNPSYAGFCVQFAARHETVLLRNVIPNRADCQVAGAKSLLSRMTAGEKLPKDWKTQLEQSLQYLRCSALESHRERADCEFLASRICFAIEDNAEGLARLRRSTELLPADPGRRLLYMRNLYEAGEQQLALQEARKAHKQFPENTRFKKLILKWGGNLPGPSPH